MLYVGDVRFYDQFLFTRVRNFTNEVLMIDFHPNRLTLTFILVSNVCRFTLFTMTRKPQDRQDLFSLISQIVNDLDIQIKGTMFEIWRFRFNSKLFAR